MRKGEKGILIGIGIFVIVAGGYMYWQTDKRDMSGQQVPFYSTATPQLASHASELYHKYDCRSCHVLWGVRDVMRAVPSPSLDGIGSLRSREWLAAYMAAEDPQSILPSRLKAEFRMPSYANIPAEEREVLVDYLASLKVKDWYLEEAKKSEYEKLTGETYRP
jgi:hypothetical protein